MNRNPIVNLVLEHGGSTQLFPKQASGKLHEQNQTGVGPLKTWKIIENSH